MNAKGKMTVAMLAAASIVSGYRAQAPEGCDPQNTVRKKSGKTPKGSNLRAGIIAQVDNLLQEHMSGILGFIAEAEDKKENVSFGVKIDCSESEPQVEVGIRYSQSVTDKRTIILDDPDQGTFEPLTKEAERQTEERRAANLEKLNGGEPEAGDKSPEEPAKGKGKKGGKGRGKKGGKNKETPTDGGEPGKADETGKPETT